MNGENEDNQEFGTAPLRDYGNLAHIPYGDEEQDAQSKLLVKR